MPGNTRCLRKSGNLGGGRDSNFLRVFGLWHLIGECSVNTDDYELTNNPGMCSGAIAWMNATRRCSYGLARR